MTVHDIHTYIHTYTQTELQRSSLRRVSLRSPQLCACIVVAVIWLDTNYKVLKLDVTYKLKITLLFSRCLTIINDVIKSICPELACTSRGFSTSVLQLFSAVHYDYYYRVVYLTHFYFTRAINTKLYFSIKQKSALVYEMLLQLL